MSDGSGIPSWQRAGTEEPPSAPDAAASAAPPADSPDAPPLPPAGDEPTESTTQTEEPHLLEQAAKFLEDPNIRNASRERKTVFLQSKGVRPDDIAKLLESTVADITEDGERAWSNTPPAPPAPRTQTRDTPPIVTFPEFLTQPTRPPPLITTQRLLNTAYITGGLMATMYGLSRYIIAPMTQNLAESRRDFATHTAEQLEILNSRLVDAVSVDPASKPKPKTPDVADDASEADSDPTELYHRDFGTQTTPTLSRRQSVSASQQGDDIVVSGHENRLKILTSHIKELEATRSNDNASTQSLRTKLSDLQTYLGEMSYQNQYYSGMNGMYGGMYGLPKTKDGKDDHIEALKSDIRAVKGVLLSARNFPVGGPRNVGRVGG